LNRKNYPGWMMELSEQDLQNIILRDRMASFLAAAINWGSQTGMSPQILDAGKQIYAALQAPVAAPAKKAEEPEKNPDDEST
jgi:hypothetical protein